MDTDLKVSSIVNRTVSQIRHFVDELKSVYLYDQPMGNFEERRTAERFGITIPIKVIPLDNDLSPLNYEFTAVTRDISHTGIGFVSSCPISDKYTLLEIEPFQGQPFCVLAKAAYCKEAGYYYQIGCEFMVQRSFTVEL